MAAEIERELISQRNKDALARRKAEGKQLGRSKGSYGVSKLDQHEDEIRKLLSHGVAKAAIARMYDSSWQTVHNWVRWKVMVRLVGKEQHDHMRNQGEIVHIWNRLWSGGVSNPLSVIEQITYTDSYPRT